MGRDSDRRAPGPQLSGQLELTPEEPTAATPPFVLAFTLPERVVKMYHRLEQPGRLAFANRLGELMWNVVCEIVDVGQLPDIELAMRRRHAEHDAAFLKAEEQRREAARGA